MPAAPRAMATNTSVTPPMALTTTTGFCARRPATMDATRVIALRIFDGSTTEFHDDHYWLLRYGVIGDAKKQNPPARLCGGSYECRSMRAIYEPLQIPVSARRAVCANNSHTRCACYCAAGCGRKMHKNQRIPTLRQFGGERQEISPVMGMPERKPVPICVDF